MPSVTPLNNIEFHPTSPAFDRRNTIVILIPVTVILNAYILSLLLHWHLVNTNQYLNLLLLSLSVYHQFIVIIRTILRILTKKLSDSDVRESTVQTSKIIM